MEAPAESRIGDEFQYDWTEACVRAVVTSLRESAGDLSGIVRMYYVNGTVGPVFSPSRLNLMAPRSRAELARELCKRDPIQGVEPEDWSEIVEFLAGRTYHLWKRGTPAIQLANYESVSDTRTLFRGFVPAGQSSIFYGDGGSLKSTIALLVAISVASGSAIAPGLAPLVTGPALYLDWETDEDELSERATALAAHFGLKGIPADLHYRPMTLALADDITRIRDEVRRLNARLVVVDSLGWACGSEPEGATSAIGTMNALRTLGKGVTRFCVAHVSHAGAQKRTGSAEIFGSRFWRQGARETWEVRIEDEQATALTAAVGLFNRKRNRGAAGRPLGFRFRFHPEGHPQEELAYTVERFDVEESGDLSQRLPLGERILRLLDQGAMTARQLAEDAEETPAKVRARLSELHKKGLVVKYPNRVWGRPTVSSAPPPPSPPAPEKRTPQATIDELFG